MDSHADKKARLETAIKEAGFSAEEALFLLQPPLPRYSPASRNMTVADFKVLVATHQAWTAYSQSEHKEGKQPIGSSTWGNKLQVLEMIRKNDDINLWEDQLGEVLCTRAAVCAKVNALVEEERQKQKDAKKKKKKEERKRLREENPDACLGASLHFLS